MPLEFVKPDLEELHFNTLLYGAGKSGKSLGAASAPGPILLLNADLPNATRTVHLTYGDKINEVAVANITTLMDATHAVMDGSFQTVILDTVGEAHRRVIEGLSNRAIRPVRDHYGDTSVYIERFCRHMCELPVNFVICAHQYSVTDDATGTVEWLPWTGTSSTALGGKLMNMVDIIGYTAAVQRDIPDKEGEKEIAYLAALVDGNGHRGGDRFNCLGLFRDVDLSEWGRIIASAPAAQEAAKETQAQGQSNEVAATGAAEGGTAS